MHGPTVDPGSRIAVRRIADLCELEGQDRRAGRSGGLSGLELGARMGGLGVRQTRNLRAELVGVGLVEAGLLAASRAEDGARPLASLPPGEGESVSVEIDFMGNVFPRKYISHELAQLRRRRLIITC